MINGMAPDLRLYLNLMSADQGYARAQFNYSYCLWEGEGVEQDIAGSARYCKMSADQGDSDAQYSYASMLDTGAGVKRNRREAARYYKMSADQGPSVRSPYDFDRGKCELVDDSCAIL